jgi:hypothetical protein
MTAMLSESARSTTAAESRYRVQTPNSTPRRTLVVALDWTTAGLGSLLSQEQWRNSHFIDFRIAGRPQNSAFKDLGGFEDKIFDQVILVGSAGRDLSRAPDIADRCEALGAKIAAIVLAPREAGRGAAAEALLVLRPLARTLALVRDGEFLRDLLLALGA